ncbi:MAG: vitamin K epoxide reductase family protein [Chloroflexi bacterium]|nr:vitamin K epoxide reductase family protein [Chloroflexota bacterium]
MMKKKNRKIKWYFVILLLLGLLISTTAVAPSPSHAQEQPTVKAVMFWMEGCGHCAWVKENVLPPLAEKYGDQWQLELIELTNAEEFDHLFDLGAALGAPREAIGVPFLLIGDAVLIGSAQIPAELPDLIERHLAAGGVGWPQAPGLEWFLPELETAVPVETAVAPAPAASLLTPENLPQPAATAAPPARDGFLLAVMILIGMVLALGYTAVRLWQARQGKIRKPPPTWIQTVLPILAVLGLGVAAYLAYVETQAVAAVCGPVGDCNAVQTSEYAYLFGIPIGVLGVLGYVAILAAWAWGQWQGDKRAALALLAMSAFGVFFSIYLTYLEPFVIGAVCAWCLTSAVLMTLLLLISVETAAPHLQPAPSSHSRRR